MSPFYQYREAPEPTAVKDAVEYISGGKVHPKDTYLIRWSHVAPPGPEKPPKRRRKRGPIADRPLSDGRPVRSRKRRETTKRKSEQ